jgi:hypothetical protein
MGGDSLLAQASRMLALRALRTYDARAKRGLLCLP